MEFELVERAHVNLQLCKGSSIKSRSEIRLSNLLLREILKEGPCLSFLDLVKLKSPQISHVVGPNANVCCSSLRNVDLCDEVVGPYTTVNNHSKVSDLFLKCTVTEKSLIQESSISNLDSLKPSKMPPEEPIELL